MNNKPVNTYSDDDYLRAAEWLEQLSEQPLDELSRRRFLLWLEATPERRALFERLLATWNDPALTQALQAILPATTKARAPLFNPAWRMGLAASFCLVMMTATAFLVIPNTSPKVATPLITKVGIRHDLQLDDGSQLEVGPASRISVSLTEQYRQVALEQGAAHFRVAKDKNRPFEVRINDASVVAVGTEFNIDKTAAQIEVTVYEGAVEVRDHPGNSPQLFRAGERALISAAGIQRLSVNLQQLVDWRSGWLELDNGKLGPLLEQLNRYSHTPIRLPDTRLASMPVAGRFYLRDTESTLRLLTELYRLQLNTVMSQGQTELQLTAKP